MAKKFHYFNLNGIGEAIRYILHYGGEIFEDVRYDLYSWPIKSVKDSLPFGHLPLYEEGNKSLNQSIAIARYLGSKHNLVPSDPWEQAELDSIVCSIYDFRAKVLPYFYEHDPVKKAALKKEILEETVVYFFSRFEKELKAHNGFFSGKLSWADFILVGIVETFNLMLGVDIEKEYPTIITLSQKIRALPGVKEYISTREPYVFDEERLNK